MGDTRIEVIATALQEENSVLLAKLAQFQLKIEAFEKKQARKRK